MYNTKTKGICRMKKALSVFSILITVALVLIFGSVLYLTGFDFTAAIAKILAVWNSLLAFAVTAPWDLSKIIVVAAFGLIVIVDFMVLVKIMQLRKPFVSYLTFLNILFIALAGVLAFIPYSNDGGATWSTITEVVRGHIYTQATEIQGYVILGAVCLFILFNLIFVILSFVDIAKTPLPLKRTKKVKTKVIKNKKKADRDIVADEFGKFQVPVEKTAPQPSPSIQEIRHAVKEELQSAPRPTEKPVERAPEKAPEPTGNRPLSLEDIRAIIRDELERSGRGGFDSFKGAPVIYAAPWMAGMPYPAYNQPGYYPPQQAPTPGVTGASKEDIRNVVSSEIEKNIPSKKEIVSLIEQEVSKLAPTSKEAVYSIVNEELIKYDALNREALDSLVTEKVDRYDAINKGLIKTQLSEEIKRYDSENRQAIRAIFAEELQKYDTANKEILHSIIDEELTKKTVSLDESHRTFVRDEVAKVNTDTKKLVDDRIVRHDEDVRKYVASEVGRSVGPQAEEIRSLFAEEIMRFAAARPTPIAAEPSIKMDEVKQLIAAEVAKSKGPQPDDIRTIFSEEISRFAASRPAPATAQPEVKLEQVKQLISDEVAKVKGPQSEDIRTIFSEEIGRYISSKPVEKAAPEVAPEPKKEVVEPITKPVNPFMKKAVEPKPQPKLEPKPVVAPVVESDEEDEDGSGKEIIRIPFQVRMKTAEKDLLTNYNTLKNYALSYAVKSRISNSGDTFRLHRETFLKITIAGKGLKLYYALNPKDYDNTTVPVQNVSHKAIYAEIPCVLKVKSPLSVKRAMQLIDDVMKSKGLEQGDIPRINWAKDFK